MRRAYENLIIERVRDCLIRPPPAPVVFPPFSTKGAVSGVSTSADSDVVQHVLGSDRHLRSLSSFSLPSPHGSYDAESELVMAALTRQIDALTAENNALQQEIEGLKVSHGVLSIARLQDSLPMLLQVPAEAREATAEAVRSMMHLFVDWGVAATNPSTLARTQSAV